ncbi:copper chaperone PCu(A)C [Streptomyces sp. AK02-01A]|uniref:copper chaperone PCu(A)C n=1 Tax=Streptomyces sp. AK02-01A TaxID=3028648 RepID=UPI0029B2D0E4|nr:copper chaperone PCu(A)C [Streptomyces sp. AK02-01A]MDX3853000.1 copper chaperone PCu(A)C [Streptomyces sp. AK02-01A]
MTRRATFVLGVGLTAALALAGCSSDSSASTGSAPELKVSEGYMPQPVSDLAAGFLIVTNSGGTADKLTSVTSDLSDKITIHRTENQKMLMVKSFDIPAGGELDLERGGNHIMFEKVKQRPQQGQKVTIQLHFEKADPIEVELPVKETTYNPAQH